MNINTFINDIDMHLNETKRMDCPVCNGKNTFTVSFINGVRVWNCYKASCNTKGNVSVRLNVDDIKKYIIEIKPKKQCVAPKVQRARTKKYVREVLEYTKNQAKWHAAQDFCLDRGMEFKVLTEDNLGV